MDLKSSDPRLYRFALYFAVSSVSPGPHRLSDDHQIASSLAERFETSFSSRRRRHAGLARFDRARFGGESAERFADDTVALSGPGSRVMPVLPPVGFGASERKTRPTLGLSVQYEIQRIVRVYAAPIARAVGRYLGDGVASAVAALLLLAEYEHRCALEYFASRHRVSRCRPPLSTSGTAAAASTAASLLDYDDFRAGRKFLSQRFHVLLEGVPAVGAQADSHRHRRRFRLRVDVLGVRRHGSRRRRLGVGIVRSVARRCRWRRRRRGRRRLAFFRVGGRRSRWLGRRRSLRQRGLFR